MKDIGDFFVGQEVVLIQSITKDHINDFVELCITTLHR